MDVKKVGLKSTDRNWSMWVSQRALRGDSTGGDSRRLLFI